jgi:hypothetical protein
VGCVVVVVVAMLLVAIASAAGIFYLLNLLVTSSGSGLPDELPIDLRSMVAAASTLLAW